jgi:hypothetical protein
VLNKILETQVLLPFILGVILCGAFVVHAWHAERPPVGGLLR